MSPSMNFSFVLTSLATQLPTIVVCFLGLILVLAQMQRMPRVAMFVAAGLALMLVAAVVQPVVQTLLQAAAVSQFSRRRAPTNVSVIFMAVALLFSMLRALALALIAYGAFVDRPLHSFVNHPLDKAWPPTPPSGETINTPGTAS
jgi:hypothetical protein